MRLLLVIACCVVLCSGAALAQLGPAGSVGLFADVAATDCNVWDIVPGVVNIYVIHVWHNGAVGVQFSAPNPYCSQMIWLTDYPVFPMTLGDSQTGVAIGYGVCAAAPTQVLTMSFFAQGITGPCCYYPVLPDPVVPSGRIEVMDCTTAVLYATGGRAIINPTASCGCDVPVEDTTWGRVKAMYR